MVQNGRVSPRKYEGRSERSGASPAYQLQQEDQGHDGQMKNGANTMQNQRTLTPAQAKREDEDDDVMVGTVPEEIEEGEEPPHRSELPT